VKKIKTCVEKIGKSGVSDVSANLMPYQDRMMPSNPENIYGYFWASMLRGAFKWQAF
jgi:hypothetical protein